MPPERVLLFRSGRHLRVAVDALRGRFPDCEIAVVGTPGSEGVIAQAGVAPQHAFIYSAKPRFTPLAFGSSRTAMAARRWRFTRVAILWNDPDGRGQGNVDRTAFGLAPLGFLAITPDGGIVERSPFSQVGHEVRRTLVSLMAGVVLGALYVPAIAIAGARRLHVGRVPRSGPVAAAGDDSAGPLRGTRPTGSAGARRDTRPAYVVVDAKDEAA
jgi:hypothetical protein